MSSIEGINAETKQRMGVTILTGTTLKVKIELTITALLASGEVVLRSDVEELLRSVEYVLEYGDMCTSTGWRDFEMAYAKFTTKTGGSDE